MSATPEQVLAYEKRIAELEASAADLQRRGVAVQARAVQAEAQLAAEAAQRAVIAGAGVVPPNAGRGPHVDRPKIPAPALFDGSMGNRIDEWLIEMQRQLDAYPVHFASEVNKLSFAVFYMGSKAGMWFRAYQTEHAHDGALVASFAELARVMRSHYQPIASSMAARTNLDRGVQSGSVSSYNSFFYSNLNYISDMSAADQVHQYTRGLKDVIKMEVVKSQSTTLTDAVNAAVAAEAYLAVIGKSPPFAHGQRAGGAPRSRWGGSGASSSSAMDVSNLNVIGSVVDADEDDGPSAAAPISAREQQLESQLKGMQKQQKMLMALNAMFGKPRQSNTKGASTSSTSSNRGKSDSRVPDVTQEDFDRCRRENRCLKCKEVGHVAFGCQKPQINF